MEDDQNQEASDTGGASANAAPHVESGPSIADTVSNRTKFYFGIGACGESATNWMFNVLVFFYYQQILGLSAILAGLAISISIVADAITDPLIGSISDRVQSRYGRRHPFLFAAPIPLAIGIFLIFHPLEWFTQSQALLFTWFITTTIVTRTFYTFFAVPHLALGAELSPNYIERTKIMSFNALFNLYGGVFMHAVAMFVVFGYMYGSEGGQLYRPAYTPVVLVSCCVVIASIFACAYGTRDQIERVKQFAPPQEPLSIWVLFSDIRRVLHNSNYRALLIGLFFLSMTIGTHETLGIYMVTFFWELSAYQYGFLMLNNIIGVHLGFFLSARLHNKFDKRWTIVAGALGLSFFWSLAVNLGLLELTPDKSSWPLVWFIIFFGIFSSFFGAVLNISVMSALADISDEHELNTGMRQEGIFYAARMFFSKAMNAMGHLIAGVALEVYIKLPPQSVPGEVPADIIFRLGVIDGPFAMIWGCIAAFIYMGYKLDRGSHAEIRRKLELKRSAAGSPS